MITSEQNLRNIIAEFKLTQTKKNDFVDKRLENLEDRVDTHQELLRGIKIIDDQLRGDLDRTIS